jgi:sulfite reductase (NADPH) flavoprotein alpha-component
VSAETSTAPAARVLEEAARRNAALGHENLGPLSESHGFVGILPPSHDLAAPHDAWVEAADELPELCSKLTVRRRLDELPLLDASTEALADRDLLRAASVIGLLAQSYHHIAMRPPDRLPEQLVRPWLQVAARLDRPMLTLTNTDYMWHNWRLIEPRAADPMRVENLRLLTPIWDHPQMENFMLVVLEMHAQAAPLVGAAARSQEHCQRGDDAALKAELVSMVETVRRLTFVSLPKINANARSGPPAVDPVVWTKLFALLPLPVVGPDDGRSLSAEAASGMSSSGVGCPARPSRGERSLGNASGAETPGFHMMDVFLGRRSYETSLGHEVTVFRNEFHRHWREFLAAVAQEPVAEYVAARGDDELKGLFSELVDAYQGPHGLIARHRLKAFPYLDAAFKTGRRRTVTGVSDLFEDRGWEQVDASLDAARRERQGSVAHVPRFARVERVEVVCPGVHKVVLDVRGLGMHCQPGDRCAILAENDPALVRWTLDALRASGDEVVDLTPEWTTALSLRPGRRRELQAPLRDVLAFGHIRPVARGTAKALHRLTLDESLREILEARTEDQWELYDLLELLTEGGFAPQRLHRAERGDSESICRLLPPLQARLYSVSSIAGDGFAADRIELCVGRLSYNSVESPTSVARRRHGTASTYLCDTIASRPGELVPVHIVHPPAFGLPADPSVPIVMFAGGTGIAPFRAFLEARVRAGSAENLLVVGARDGALVPFREELETYAARGEAEVLFAFSREAGDRRHVDDLVREPGVATRLRELVRSGARIYVCGRATFARSVLDAIADILDEPGGTGRETLFDLVAQQRYMHDVFTTYTGSTAEPRTRVEISDLIRRASGPNALWMAIDGRVYDLTEFAEIHPGGRKLIESFAGTDATRSYRIVEHHLDPEVEATLSMFEVGVMRRLHFARRWAVAVGEQGLEHLPLDTLFRRWVRCLYLLVEIENAFVLETSLRDEPLRSDELSGAPPDTPYRLQFGIEAHSRFLTQTVPYVCSRFAGLWRTTSGPCEPEASFRAFDEQIEGVLTNAAANSARAAAHEVEKDLAREGASAELIERISWLREADASYLDSAKMLVASGVRVFQEHEADVVKHGAGALLDALLALPGLTQAHLEAVG